MEVGGHIPDEVDGAGDVTSEAAEGLEASHGDETLAPKADAVVLSSTNYTIVRGVDDAAYGDMDSESFPPESPQQPDAEDGEVVSCDNGSHSAGGTAASSLSPASDWEMLDEEGRVSPTDEVTMARTGLDNDSDDIEQSGKATERMEAIAEAIVKDALEGALIRSATYEHAVILQEEDGEEDEIVGEERVDGLDAAMTEVSDEMQDSQYSDDIQPEYPGAYEHTAGDEEEGYTERISPANGDSSPYDDVGGVVEPDDLRIELEHQPFICTMPPRDTQQQADAGSVHDAQDVSAYDTQDVSAYDTQNVSACDAQDVSAYNAQEVSAYDTLDVSAYDAQEVSAYDTQYVSAYDTQDLSAYDTQDVSAYDAQDVSAYDTQDVSAYDTQDLSAYDTQEVSAYDTQDVPAYDAQDVSAYDAKDVPTYDTQDVPAYDAQDLSGYDVQDVPTYDTQDMPAYDIQDVPAHKKQDVSVFETQGISAYDAQYGVHVDDTDGVHVDDTDGVHVDDTDGTRHGATPDVNTNFATPRNIAGKTDDSDGSFENVDPAPSLIEYVTTSQNIGPETVPECATSKEAASTGLEEVPQSDIAGHGGVRAPASSPRYDDGVPVTDLDEDICDPDLSSPEVAPSSAPGELDIGEGSGPFESVLCPLAPEGEALAFDVYSSATRPVKASPWAQQMEDPSIRKRHYVEEEVLTEARVEVAAARNESSVLADTNWVTVAYFLCLSLVAAIVCVCAEGSVSMGWILSALALGCLILFAILKV